VFDTSRHSPEELAATVVGELLDGLQTGVSPLRSQSAGRAA
jgi:hypothetical protein